MGNAETCHKLMQVLDLHLIDQVFGALLEQVQLVGAKPSQLGYGYDVLRHFTYFKLVNILFDELRVQALKSGRELNSKQGVQL